MGILYREVEDAVALALRKNSGLNALIRRETGIDLSVVSSLQGATAPPLALVRVQSALFSVGASFAEVDVGVLLVLPLFGEDGHGVCLETAELVTVALRSLKTKAGVAREIALRGIEPPGEDERAWVVEMSLTVGL